MPDAPSRRDVRYKNIGEVAVDAKRLMARDAPTTGNWTKGQIFEHLARIIDGSTQGFGMQAPWIVRAAARIIYKNTILTKGMRPGFKLNGKAKKLLMVDSVDDREACDHLCRAIETYQNQSERHAHPFFGTLTNEEWNTLHCRHSDLHMSYIAEPKQ